MARSVGPTLKAVPLVEREFNALTRHWHSKEQVAFVLMEELCCTKSRNYYNLK